MKARTPEELEEYIRQLKREIRFDRFGYFSPYTGYWLYKNQFQFQKTSYSLSTGKDHPHDPDGDFSYGSIDKSESLKEIVDKAKQLRILDLQKELKELTENSQYDLKE